MLRLAWRNIWRNRRRTLITVFSIGAGTGAIMFGQSFARTFQNRLIARSIGVLTGDLRIESVEVRDAKLPDQDIENPSAIEAVLDAEPRVKVYGERVIFTGLVGSSRASIGVTVIGGQPDKEGYVNEVPSHVIEGSSCAAPGNTVLIGQSLAKDLGVRLMDKIVLIGQATTGELGAEPFRVGGIFKTGSVLFDSKLVIAPLKPLQEMLYKDGKVTDFICKLQDVDQADAVQAALAEKLAERHDVRVLAWHDVDKEVVATKRWTDAVTTIFLFVIYTVATLGILNTMLMSIFERVREFGVLKAIGAQPVTLMRLVIAECGCIGFLGSGLGLVIGSAVILYFGRFGLKLPIGESMSYFFPFDSVLYLRFAWGGHAFALVTIFTVCLLTGIVPGYVAYRLKVAEALRAV